MKKSLFKCYLLLIGLVLGADGCSSNDGNAEKIVRLKTPAGFVTLKLPKDYVRYSQDNDWLATLLLYYPEMRPAVPLNSRESTMIQVIVDKKDPVVSFKSRINGDHYDESKPGATYRVGVDGIYEIFSSVKPLFVAKSYGTYFVFKGSDGRSVLVLGSSQGNYSFRRKISDELIIQYLVPVNQVVDFYGTDKAVSDFVSNHIENS